MTVTDLLIFKCGKSFVGDREKKISTQKGKDQLLPDKWIFRHGQLARDDDRRICLAMASTDRQRSLD